MIKDQYEIEVLVPVKIEVTVDTGIHENKEFTHWVLRAKGIQGAVSFTDKEEEIEDQIKKAIQAITESQERNYQRKQDIKRGKLKSLKGKLPEKFWVRGSGEFQKFLEELVEQGYISEVFPVNKFYFYSFDQNKNHWYRGSQRILGTLKIGNQQDKSNQISVEYLRDYFNVNKNK